MRENPKGNKEIWESRETSSSNLYERKKNIGIFYKELYPVERPEIKVICLNRRRIQKIRR